MRFLGSAGLLAALTCVGSARAADRPDGKGMTMGPSATIKITNKAPGFEVLSGRVTDSQGIEYRQIRTESGFETAGFYEGDRTYGPEKAEVDGQTKTIYRVEGEVVNGKRTDGKLYEVESNQLVLMDTNRLTSKAKAIIAGLGIKMDLVRTLTGNGWSFEGTQKMRFGDRKVDAKEAVLPDGKKVYFAMTPAGALHFFFYADVEYKIDVKQKQDEFSPQGDSSGGERAEILVFGRRLNSGFSAMSPAKGGGDYAALTLASADNRGNYRAVTLGKWSRDSAVEISDVGDAVAGYAATKSDTRFTLGDNGVQILNAGGCVKDSKGVEYCGEKKGGKVRTTIH